MKLLLCGMALVLSSCALSIGGGAVNNNWRDRRCYIQTERNWCNPPYQLTGMLPAWEDSIPRNVCCSN